MASDHSMDVPVNFTWTSCFVNRETIFTGIAPLLRRLGTRLRPVRCTGVAIAPLGQAGGLPLQAGTARRGTEQRGTSPSTPRSVGPSCRHACRSFVISVAVLVRAYYTSFFQKEM